MLDNNDVYRTSNVQTMLLDFHDSTVLSKGQVESVLPWKNNTIPRRKEKRNVMRAKSNSPDHCREPDFQPS